MAGYTCDGCNRVEVDVGLSNPTLVLCGACNGGDPIWNCVDDGNMSCNCKVCGPCDYLPEEPPPIDHDDRVICPYTSEVDPDCNPCFAAAVCSNK